MNLKSGITICLLLLAAFGGRAELILSDTFDVTGGNSPGTGFGADGASAGVNYQLTNRLSGSAANGVRYLKSSAATKAASSYSIRTNKLNVAAAANPGRFTFTTDGSTPLDLGAPLGVANATAADPVVYELGVRMANQSTGTERTSFGIGSVDDGIQTWHLGIQFVRNGSNLDIYRRVDANSNPTGTDYNDVIATLPGLAGAEVDLKMRITDAGSESGAGKFNSSYEVFANGASVYASPAGDFRFANSAVRFVLFDTAPSAGPATYDAFSLNLVSSNAPPSATNNAALAILSQQWTTAGFQLTWSSQPGSNYTVLKATNSGAPHWVLATNVTAAGTNTTIVDAAVSSSASYYQVALLANTGLTVNHVTASQRTGTGLVDIYYDLADLYDGYATVSVLVSTDGGQTYGAPAATFSGDVGAMVRAGAGNHIVWNAGADWASGTASNVVIRLVVDRANVGPDMAFVPAGAFSMGDAKAEGLDCESPVHTVNVSAFYVGRGEVTKALWDNVLGWATNHGYQFDNPGFANAPQQPVQRVSWYDAVKWCNARSEMEGFAPAYFQDRAWTQVYRTGQVDLAEADVRWAGAGYRLPTEAEWEKAARGSLSGKRFPFGDTITQAQADYWSTGFESYDVNGTPGAHPLATEFPNVVAAGSFPPSGFGLYDMAGNVWEWCWDYYGDTWYANGQATTKDTRGPASASWGGDRVCRGGSGVDIAWKSRVANRADAPPRFAMGHFGFRVAMPAGDKRALAESPVLTITLTALNKFPAEGVVTERSGRMTNVQ